MFDQRYPNLPPPVQMSLPSGGAVTSPEASALFQNPAIMQQLLGHFMRNRQGAAPQVPQGQPAQAPQMQQPDLGPMQQSPMGMNPMLARVMQRFAQPGGMRPTGAAMTGREAAVPADVMMTQPM